MPNCTDMRMLNYTEQPFFTYRIAKNFKGPVKLSCEGNMETPP